LIELVPGEGTRRVSPVRAPSSQDSDASRRSKRSVTCPFDDETMERTRKTVESFEVAIAAAACVVASPPLVARPDNVEAPGSPPRRGMFSELQVIA
jgi:hypothetical protein